MEYVKYFIACPPAEQEILLALLSEFPFDSFEEADQGLAAFIPKSGNTAALQKEIEQLLTGRSQAVQLTEIPYTNWNAAWEASFEPIRIPNHCLVRAEFHDPDPTLPYEIIIQPEMAFGTGHHATTYLMMKRMFDLDWQKKEVLDFGCGTGILAILASKLGARAIKAIDNDILAYENTLKQLALNDIHNVQAAQATLDRLPSKRYDIILANINRNVLLATMESLSEQLQIGGDILFSGILEKDVHQLKEAITAAGLKLSATEQKEDWICLHAKKMNPA